jgi:hypothetical protein
MPLPLASGVLRSGASSLASRVPSPFPATERACQFLGGVWADVLYVPIFITSLFPSDVELGYR